MRLVAILVGHADPVVQTASAGEALQLTERVSPVFLITVTVCPAFPRSESTTNTLAPLAAIAIAVALPMPNPAPVIRATFCSKLIANPLNAHAADDLLTGRRRTPAFPLCEPPSEAVVLS